MPSLQFFDLYQPNDKATARDLAHGLLQNPAQLSFKYFYDKLGSCLFDAITELPEYYPTRTEAAILREQRPDIAASVPRGAALIDLGAGSCAKAASLFDTLQPSHYVAVDISAQYLRGVLQNLQLQHTSIQMAGVGMDFSSALDLPIPLLRSLREAPITAFYPGSSISNFAPDAALALLQRIRALCASGATGGGLLIGVDLVKPIDVLEPAYDDPLGVTAAFNLNMLRHINTLLSSNFDVRDWQHVAFFNAQESRIEMHVQAKRDVRVAWQDVAGTQQRALPPCSNPLALLRPKPGPTSAIILRCFGPQCKKPIRILPLLPHHHTAQVRKPA
jgi:L-histidine Nalpha-methyltransferase